MENKNYDDYRKKVEDKLCYLKKKYAVFNEVKDSALEIYLGRWIKNPVDLKWNYKKSAFRMRIWGDEIDLERAKELCNDLILWDKEQRNEKF
jgi:hypothetical protein